ncbi:MAG: hypothetical protein J3Q66DRAFT_379625, partial [Benniella sp.]
MRMPAEAFLLCLLLPPPPPPSKTRPTYTAAVISAQRYVQPPSTTINHHHPTIPLLPCLHTVSLSLWHSYIFSPSLFCLFRQPRRPSD